MEELQIAKAEAEVLNMLDKEEIQFAKLETRTQQLAMKRASATNRDFHTVLAEVELRVRVQLAGILAKTIDPVLAGLKNLVTDGGGVCQEELEIGVEARDVINIVWTTTAKGTLPNLIYNQKSRISPERILTSRTKFVQTTEYTPDDIKGKSNWLPR
ncbi:hypothetical protein NC652_023284 [Populus alba x Populus x berolinensis]|nr:hypothetical protein NC652_023284 [Populus alba x Populus x berolinensis]